MLWLSLTLVLFASSLYFPLHSNSLLEQTNSSRVLLLTAHPDDECLFFAPTLLALRGQPEIYSLTMSTGNADGLGETRRDELGRSLDALGIDLDKRWIVDHPMLQDNITLEWDPSVIAVVIAPYVVQHHITTILTFDARGVSSHPNHRSLPSGALQLVKTLQSNVPESVPRIFGLVTVPVLPKYIGALAAVYSRLRAALERLLRIDTDQPVVFVSGVKEYTTAVRAMRAHASQLVWFRYLYVAYSRYMWVNEWVQV